MKRKQEETPKKNANGTLTSEKREKIYFHPFKLQSVSCQPPNSQTYIYLACTACDEVKFTVLFPSYAQVVHRLIKNECIPLQKHTNVSVLDKIRNFSVAPPKEMDWKEILVILVLCLPNVPSELISKKLDHYIWFVFYKLKWEELQRSVYPSVKPDMSIYFKQIGCTEQDQ